MGFVYESFSDNKENKSEIPLGIQLSNETSIFKTLYSTNEQAKENLKSLLLTSIGERYMLPDFGCDLLKILFEPNTDELKDAISNIISESVSYWLPYVTIEHIDVITSDDASFEHFIEISIKFSVRNFNTDSIKITLNSNNVLTVT